MKCITCGREDWETLSSTKKEIVVSCRHCDDTFGVDITVNRPKITGESMLNLLGGLFDCLSKLRQTFKKLIKEDRQMKPEEHAEYDEMLKRGYLGVDYLLPNPLTSSEMAELFPQGQKIKSLGDYLRESAHVKEGTFNMEKYWRRALSQVNARCGGMAIQLAIKWIKTTGWDETKVWRHKEDQLPWSRYRVRK